MTQGSDSKHVRQPVLLLRIVAGVSAALLLLLSSCDAQQDPDTHASATQAPSDAVCLDAQRAAYPQLVDGWRKLAIAVTANESGAAPVTLEPWTSGLVEVRTKLTKAGCPDPPRELVPIVALTADLERGSAQITVDQARSLGRLLSELRNTLQVSPVAFDERLLALPMTCEEISQQVSATYAPRSVATRTGRDLWAVMSLQNKSSRGVYAAVDGQLTASHPVGGSPGSVSSQSTSRGVYAGPLRTSYHPLLAPGGERLHLTSDGRATSLTLTVSVGFSEGTIDCPIRAERTDAPTITVAAAGDIACGPKSTGYNRGRGVPGRCHQKATSDLIKEISPDAVFAIGDLQYQAGTLSLFRGYYGSTWGRFKDITYPVLGDHEYGSPGAEGYFSYFGRRATPLDPDCTKGCRGYYSVDLGAWHVVSLNVNCKELPDGDGCDRQSAQNRWLQKDLKAANKTSACTVVLTHTPRWSSNHFASPELDPLIKTMHQNGVELVLSGDSHTYERFAPQTPAGRVDRTRGITQIVVGTGGAHFTGLGSTEGNSVVGRENVFGVLELTLQDGRYKWAFRADPSTPFTDSGSQACH
jgi:Calcineurin-like phosphoesterase